MAITFNELEQPDDAPQSSISFNEIEEPKELSTLDFSSIEEASVEDIKRDEYRSSASRAFGNTAVGRLVGDFLMGTEKYFETKSKKISETQQATKELIPDTGVSSIDKPVNLLEETAGFMSGSVREAGKDIGNILVNIGTAVAQTPHWLMELQAQYEKGMAETDPKLSEEERNRLVSEAEKDIDILINQTKDIGEGIEKTKDEYIPFLKENRWEDKATDIMSVIGGGVSLVRSPKKIEDGLTKIQKITTGSKDIAKRSTEYATGATLATSTEANIPTATGELLDVKEDSVLNRKGLTFAEEFVFGFLGDTAVELVKPIGKQLFNVFKKADIDSPTLTLEQENAELQKLIESIESTEVKEYGQPYLLTGDDLSPLTATEQVEQLRNTTGTSLTTTGGGGGQPPKVTGAEPYFGAGDESNLPANISPRDNRRGGLLSEFYSKKRAVDPETGVAYPQVRTVIMDEFFPLYQVERYKRMSEGLGTQGTLVDADWYEAQDIAQSSGTWSRAAIGMDKEHKNVFMFAHDPNNDLYQRVDSVLNLREIVDEALGKGASVEDVEKLMTANDVVSDYYSIDADLSTTMSDILRSISDSVKSSRGNADMLDPSDPFAMVGGELGQKLSEFYFKTSDAVGVKEFPWDELEVLEKEISTLIRKGKLPDASKYDEMLDDMLQNAARRPQMLREEAEQIIESFANSGNQWSQDFAKQFTDFNKWVLAERVRSGELSKDTASAWFKKNPMHIPAYKVLHNATGTTERLFNTGAKVSIKERRKISPKETRAPLDTLQEYLVRTGNAIEHARIRRNILDYYINNFGNDTANVFREPASAVREAIAKLESGERVRIKAEELLPYSKDYVELPGDKITFNVGGGQLELTIMDKDVYALLARSSHDNTALDLNWRTYRNINDYMLRTPITVVQTPFITIKEFFDATSTSRAPFIDRINPWLYIKGAPLTRIQTPQRYNEIVLNYGMGTKGGAWERLPGETRRESLVQKLDNADAKMLEALGTSSNSGLTRNANLAIHNYMNAADMLMRIQERDALIAAGFSPRHAMRLAKRRGVNFSQLGSGLSSNSKSRLVTMAEEAYAKAIKSKDKEAIKVTRSNLLRIRGYVGISGGSLLPKVRADVLFGTNDFTYKMMNTSAFGRSFVNSMDNIGSAIAYERKRWFTGVLATTMLMIAAKSAYNENGTAELFNQTNQSPSTFTKYNQFGEAMLPRGYQNIFTAPAEKAVLSISASLYQNAPNMVREVTEKDYPEIHKALLNYQSVGNNDPFVTLADAAIESIRYEPPVAGAMYRTLTGEDYAGRPIVSPYLEQGPSYLKTNSRTSNAMNQLAKWLETEQGAAISPAKWENFLTDITGGTFDYLMYGTDVILNAAEIGPALSVLKPGEAILNGQFLSSEQVAPDEWKVSSKYYRMMEHVMSKQRAADALKADVEKGHADHEELVDFLRDNDVELRTAAIIGNVKDRMSAANKEMILVREDIHPDYSITDAGIFGSKIKQGAIDDVKYKRYTIMKEVLEQVRNIPGGDKFLDERVIDADSKTRFLVGFVNKFTNEAGETYEEPVTLPKSTELISWDMLEDGIEKMPVIDTNFSTTSKTYTHLTDEYEIDEEDILKINASVSSLVQLPTDFITRVQYAESGFRNIANESGKSTASGLMQVTDSTWKLGVEKFGDKYGVSMDDKNNPYMNTLIAGAILADDIAYFNRYFEGKGRLTASEGYVVHHLGRPEATKFLEALRGVGSSKTVDRVLSKDTLAANPNIVKKDNGEYRTVDEMFNELKNRFWQDIPETGSTN